MCAYCAHICGAIISLALSITCEINETYSLYPLLPLLLDIDLRELPLDGFYNGGVLRFSAGAGQGIASVSGIFYRIPPGFRKYKIGFREVFPFGVRQFRHSLYPRPFQGLYRYLPPEAGCGLIKVALQSTVGRQKGESTLASRFRCSLALFPFPSGLPATLDN